MRKNKSLREKFEEEYTATVEPADNKDGFKIKYVYYGNWYLYDLPEDQLKRVKYMILAFFVFDVILFALAGILPSEVNRLAFVAYPGIIAVLAIVLKTIGLMQFLFAKRRTTKSNFEDAGRRIRVWSIIQIICTLLSFVGSGYYLFKYGFRLRWLVTGVLYLLDAIAATILLRIFTSIPTKVEKNDILKHVKRVMDDSK